ncbi:MAG: hypothetical protein DCC57_20390 [Chloroflexi bacterium]|nr:MAG: hypothetical protein DCC57_20390 [Chloroflexota bacterium]
MRNINAMYINGTGVSGQGGTSICMAEGARSELLSGMWGAITYPYRFRILSGAGEMQHATDVIFTYPLVQFWVDDPEIEQGSCTTVRWAVDGAQAVYFNGEGVAGNDSREVCPYDPATYQLDVAGQCLTSQYYVSVDTQVTTPTEVPGMADLVTSVDSFDVSCDSDGCYTYIYFTVSNYGDASSSSFTVGVYADEEPDGYVGVEGLAVGESISLSATLGPGGNCYNPDCSVSVWADIYGEVPEYDEENNGSEGFNIG